jgi:signal transduction histidine kinase
MSATILPLRNFKYPGLAGVFFYFRGNCKFLLIVYYRLRHNANKNMKNLQKSKLYFRVSSGLKRIIGQDLIVSDFVAVFELVKNSFDAHASNVEIVFESDSIWIVDDGKGMSFEDIKSKWLFVAYSAKKDGSEDQDYRGRKHRRGAFAGNKGVGRFSCDRLGTDLLLQTRSSPSASVETVTVNWDQFEKNGTDEFDRIPVVYSQGRAFSLPDDVKLKTRGTALRISGLRDVWSRQKLLELKSHLTKLINPFDGASDAGFSVTLTASHERIEDLKNVRKLELIPEEQRPVVNRDVVNGPIENFIFTELASKTTRLEIAVTEDKTKLRCTLIDRGQLIYAVEEKNPYPLLAEADFSCKLFFLNQSAKLMFAKRMGVPSVRFGSVFLFRNGFRVFPIGEEGDDTFDIDRRKQQGYARYLGSREIIGRIDVRGDEHLFREASSRDQGLIDTVAYRQLQDCFKEKCLKRLERYVVGVTWQDKLDKLREDASGLRSAPMRARIIELVAELVSTSEIQLLDYSADIVDVLSDKVEQFEKSLVDLKAFANATGDGALLKRISAAGKRFKELQEAEARAIEIAEQEKEARRVAELRARVADEARVRAEQKAKNVEAALEEEKKRTLFLASTSTLDVETITNLHHQVIICAADIHELIEVQIDKLRNSAKVDKESLFGFLEQMTLKNQQVLAIARMATKANFRMESDVISDDIVAYTSEYLQNIAKAYHRIQLSFEKTDRTFERSFKPIELSIVIDNLISNAKKADSPTMHVSFKWPSTGILKIIFTDQGSGLKKVFSDADRIFEKGVSTTDGSGLGLYHVRQIIESMGGSISYEKPESHGARFVIALPKTK